MDELDEKVLDVAQRMKRAQIMRRNQAKIERARELAKKRLAPEKNIKKRAYAAARQIVRTRVAGKHGAEYEKLGPSEKIAIDRALEGKQKAIKKLALRLIPRIKQAEAKRLQSYMKGQSLQNHGAKEGKAAPVTESINERFQEAFAYNDSAQAKQSPADNSNIDVKKSKAKAAKKNSPIIQYSKFEEERDCDSSAYKAIAKKSRKSGIDENILGTVYDRGMDAWSEDTGVSQQQYAFARVNSYINQGKTYFNEDSDLHELSTDTLKRYVNKAKDAEDKATFAYAYSMGHKAIRDKGDYKKKADRKSANRKQGILNATDRIMQREEIELDEISSKTLDRYVNKASSDFTMSNVGARSAKDSEKPYFQSRVAKRRKGIAQAIDKTDAATGREPEKPVKVPATNEAREPGKAYVKRVKRNDGESMLVSSTKWGQKKYWRDSEGGLKKAREHSKADIQEEVQQTNEAYSHLSTAELRKHAEAAIKKNDRQKVRDITQEIKSRIEKKTGNPYVAPEKFSAKTAGDFERLTGKKVPAHRVEEVQQTNENFIDGKGPGKSGDAARHGLKGKSASELKKIRSSETASPRQKQLAHWMLNMHHNEETELDEGGLWDNIHAKRKRIKAGSGERMRKPGSEGAPTKQDFKDASEAVEKVVGTNCRNCSWWKPNSEKPVTKEELNKNGGLKAPNAEYIAMSKRIDLGTLPGEDSSVKVKGFCDHEEINEWVTERMCCSQWDADGMIRDYKGQSPVMEEGESIVPQTTSPGSKVRRKIEKVDRAAPHTEHGKQAEIKHKIIDEEGNTQPDPKKRLQGTDSLVKAYKKDTPGQVSESLNESFNIAFASGVGVTLTAADLGMRAQGGFAYHPSVVQQMEEQEVEEEVRSADVKGVVVKTATGKTIVRKQKVDRKIIGSGNLTDGKPDDTL